MLAIWAGVSTNRQKWLTTEESWVPFWRFAFFCEEPRCKRVRMSRKGVTKDEKEQCHCHHL